jgi:hypothetical protein
LQSCVILNVSFELRVFEHLLKSLGQRVDISSLLKKKQVLMDKPKLPFPGFVRNDYGHVEAVASFRLELQQKFIKKDHYAIQIESPKPLPIRDRAQDC